MQVMGSVDKFHSLNKIDTVKILHISHAATTKIWVENISLVNPQNYF